MPATSLEPEFPFRSVIALELCHREPRSVLAFPKARNYPDVSRSWRIQYHHLQSVAAAHPGLVRVGPRNFELASAWRCCAEPPAQPGKFRLRIRDPLHSNFPEGTAFP